eukprot:m.325700 g.325700  ORF g.325700 m.325700 type:complete len:116 (-) comp55564_c2_seq14:1263-1610(-)
MVERMNSLPLVPNVIVDLPVKQARNKHGSRSRQSCEPSTSALLTWHTAAVRESLGYYKVLKHYFREKIVLGDRKMMKTSHDLGNIAAHPGSTAILRNKAEFLVALILQTRMSSAS